MMRMPSLLTALLLTVSALGLSVANSPNEFRINGTAVNAVTGQPLSKVEISIGPAEGPGQVRSVHTGAEGHFSFENLPPQKYWLAARGRGFSMQRFNQHGQFSSAIAVGSNKNSENLVFRVFPDATIVGTIADDQGDAIAGAQVMLFRTGVQDGESSTRLRAQTMTDDQGHYHLAHVPEGPYYIAVSARPWYAENNPVQQRGLFSGVGPIGQMALSNAESAEETQVDVTYPLTFYPGVTDPESATPIMVKPGDRLIADLSLSAVPALHVRVSDSSIEPQTPGPLFRPIPFSVNLNEKVFGVTVPLSTSFESPSPGQFQINGVPPGHLLLTEQTLGKNPTSREKQIDVSDNSEIDAADATGLASITGVLQLDSGEPLSRPMFLQLVSSSGENFSAPTSATGEFQLNGVTPAKYELSVFGRGDTFVNNISVTGATVVGREVQIGADAAIQMKVTLSEGMGRINGTALQGGNPFAGAMIVLVPQDIQHNSPLVRRDQSDSDGTFSLYNVVPGAYTVVAIQNGWDLQWLSPDVLQPLLKGGEVVKVSAHGKYQIKVNVQ